MNENNKQSESGDVQNGSDLPEEKSEIIPGFINVEDFMKASFSTMQCGIKSANRFPIDDDFKYYSCFPTFHEVRNNGIKKIEDLMQKIVGITGSAGSMQARDTEEKFKLVIDANDILLDRTSILLDDEAGIKRKPTVELVVTQTDKQNNCGSWNTKTLQVSSVPSSTHQVQAVRLLAAKNVQRPQLSFKDKIDNSTKPWVPRITEKPNDIKPLGIYLIDGENGQVFCHPYEFELDRFTPPDNQLEKEKPIKYKSLEETPLVMVEKLEDLQNMMEVLKDFNEIAVDLEHHSYRTFQGITCLMQISTREHDFLIDTLALRSELHILNEIFTKPSVLKVFHGAESDIQWLQRDLSLYIVNMFDTHQAAKHLNLPYLSLSYLLRTICQIDPNKHFQLADWRIRPLPEELIKYAREDTHYLLFIKDVLRNRLIDTANGQSNILKAVYDRGTINCKQIYEKPVCDEASCMTLYRKSQKMFNNRQLYALKELYMWRDTTAREEDDSIGYVLPNHMLLNIAETLPREMQGILACCNPIPPLVRQNLLKLHKIVLRARDQPLIKPILEQDIRHRVSQINRNEAESWIWSPHDLPQDMDTQPNLPCLLDDEKDERMQENIQLSNIQHNITVFDGLSSGDEDSVAMEKLRKARTLFVSPYERYKLVIPMVAAEEQEERLRNEREEKEKLEMEQRKLKQEAVDTAERIERIHQHFLQVANPDETVQENNPVVVETRNPVIYEPLGSIPGAKKRKREHSFSNDDNQDNIECDDDYVAEKVSKKQKHTFTNKEGVVIKNLSAFSGSGLRIRDQKKLNKKELREKGMLPRTNFNYKQVDFGSFGGGSEADPSKIVTVKREKPKDKSKRRGKRLGKLG